MANICLVCKCQDIVVKDTEKKTYEGSRAEDAKDCKTTQNDIRLERKKTRKINLFLDEESVEVGDS